MTSELNLTDEGELQEEEKPRLVIGDNVPPSIHHGHKLDMKDRDPIKMNDHVKVKCKLYLFRKYSVAPVSCMGFFTQQALACASFVQCLFKLWGYYHLKNFALEFWFVNFLF